MHTQRVTGIYEQTETVLWHLKQQYRVRSSCGYLCHNLCMLYEFFGIYIVKTVRHVPITYCNLNNIIPALWPLLWAPGILWRALPLLPVNQNPLKSHLCPHFNPMGLPDKLLLQIRHQKNATLSILHGGSVGYSKQKAGRFMWATIPHIEINWSLFKESCSCLSELIISSTPY